MSNLARTQADWNKLGRELGNFLGPYRQLRDLERKFAPENTRTQIVEEMSVNAFTSLWTLAGVNVGTNTDEDGVVYVRITDETPGAGQATVDVYKAVGGGAGNKVATGSAADGATVTLAAANSSGLTGTVKLATVTASESDDKHKLRIFPDWDLRAAKVFDGSEPEHGFLRAAHLGAQSSARSSILDAMDAWAVATGSFLRSRWRSFNKSSKGIPINRGTKNDQGTITTVYTGLLEDGRQDMVDELTAGAQKVVKNAVTAASGTFDSPNQGKGTFAAPSVEEWALDGLVTAVCVDATIGQEEFELSQYLTVTKRTVLASDRLRIKKSYASPALGIRSGLLSRTLNFDAGSSLHFATAADWTINGETSANTNDGVLYLQIVAGVVDPAKFIIKGYKASTLASDQQVFTSTEGAANAVVTLTAINSSGMTGTGKIGTAPVASNTATLNLQTFRTKNTSQGIPDKFTFAITVASRGQFQAQIADMFGYALNSATSGSETLNEGYVRAGTFPPYSVLDA